MDDKKQPDFLVLGSGMSAIAVSCLLAKAGHSVTMLEAHTAPGGNAHTFEVDHFQFCAQVHYIWGCAPGLTIFEFLKKLGLEEEVRFKALDPNGYDVAVLPDGKRVGIPYGFDKLLDHIDAAYPGQRTKIKAFLDIIAELKKEIYRLPRHVYWWHYLTQGWSSRNVIRYRHHTLQQVFDEFQLSQEVQAVLSCQIGDVGASPEVLSVLAYASLLGGYNEGAYYPVRHFKYFIERLTEVITNSPGCKIIYNAKVEKITTDKNCVTAVKTSDGKTYSADRIICNMDPQTTARMIGFDKIPKLYRSALQYEYSSSSFVVYLGLKGIDLRKYGFGNSNIWHLTQWDMNALFRQQLAGDFSSPWLFISSPFLQSPDQTGTPPGCQNLVFGTICHYDQFASLYQNDRDAYKKLKNQVAEQLLDIIEKYHVPNIRHHIKSQTVGTPVTNELFCGAAHGNCYGSVMTPNNVGLSRLGAVSPWNNFYWCNASSGFAGIHGTISTGINLYIDLTGDDFLPVTRNLSTVEDHINYAKQHA